MNRLLFLVFSFFGIIAKAQNFSEEIVSGENLKTVVCYGYTSGDNFSNRTNNTAIISLNSNSNVFLEFDDLDANYSQYRARIINCDADWQQSNLLDLEFMDGYNEFIINNYSVSEGTKVSYYHYSYRIPKVKLAGNYVIQIFKNTLGEDLVIQKKFRILDPKVNVSTMVFQAQDPAIWRTKQQVNIEIDNTNYFISNPKKELRVFVRQNQRDNTMVELNNSNLNTASSTKLRYNFFNNENTFNGGNEFRIFDVSMSFSGGVNVAKNTTASVNEMQLRDQFSRGTKGYLNSMDNNGGFIINTNLGNNADLSADYVKVKCSFNYPETANNEKIIMFGKYNNWDLKEGEMDFNEETQKFEKTLLLKNGIYDFAFAKLDKGQIDEILFEGNFSEAENNYEVFVYQKAPGFRNFQLIGYAQTNFNTTKR